MIRYAITGGDGTVASVTSQVARLVDSGLADWIQIREKHFTARELFEATVAAVCLARPRGVRVFVNSRADISIAAGADGVHLPSKSGPPPMISAYRLGRDLKIGVSCHSAEELAEAAAGGADFALLSPVFAPISKKTSSERPLGLDGFTAIVRGARIPVLALGGITWDNASACMDAGAAGVAGISLFAASSPEDPAACGQSSPTAAGS